jgi:mono/diheme cytochrome c family protein
VGKWLIVAALGAFATQPAQAGDPMAGEVLAEVWCASCHSVGPDNIASDAAPSFYTVMNVQQRSTDFLRGWLVNPHGAMPDPNLTRGEIDDIVSYMETIRRD